MENVMENKNITVYVNDGTMFEGYIHAGEATLTGAKKPEDIHSLDWDLKIPRFLGGSPVRTIAERSFEGQCCNSLTIPDTVRRIKNCAFKDFQVREPVEVPIGTDWEPKAFYAGTPLKCRMTGTYAPGDVQYYQVTGYGDLILTAWTGEGGWLPRQAWGKHKIVKYWATRQWCVEYLGIPADLAETVIMYSAPVKYVEYAPGTERIPAEAFSGGSLRGMHLPDTIKRIGKEAFSNCHIKAVTFPPRLRHIGARAFEGNDLKQVTIPKTVRYIGRNAFADCQLESFTIPDEVPVQRRCLADPDTPIEYPTSWVDAAHEAWDSARAEYRDLWEPTGWVARVLD